MLDVFAEFAIYVTDRARICTKGNCAVIHDVFAKSALQLWDRASVLHQEP